MLKNWSSDRVSGNFEAYSNVMNGYGEKINYHNYKE